MKRTTFLFSIVILIAVFVFTSCEKDEYLDWKYLNESWLEQHKNDSAWIVEPSGLQYRVLEEGILDGKPTDKSIVYVERTCWYINGDTIYPTRVIRDEVARFEPGEQEILKKMKINSKYQFRLPYHLALGSEGDSSIPPYTTMLYQLKLIRFESYNPYD